MIKILVFLSVISLIVCFDKRQLMKGKFNHEKHRIESPIIDDSLGNEKSKHPISRRVLRWERSAEPLFEPQSDFPVPDELEVMPGDLDFIKIRPFRHLIAKTKPSPLNNEIDYDPTIEF